MSREAAILPAAQRRPMNKRQLCRSWHRSLQSGFPARVDAQPGGWMPLHQEFSSFVAQVYRGRATSRSPTLSLALVASSVPSWASGQAGGADRERSGLAVGVSQQTALTKEFQGLRGLDGRKGAITSQRSPELRNSQSPSTHKRRSCYALEANFALLVQPRLSMRVAQGQPEQRLEQQTSFIFASEMYEADCADPSRLPAHRSQAQTRSAAGRAASGQRCRSASLMCDEPEVQARHTLTSSPA